MVQRKKTKKTPSAARYLLFFSFTTAMLTGGFFFYTKVPHRPSQKTKTMVFASLRTQPKGTTTNKHYWIRSQCLDTSINRARICKKMARSSYNLPARNPARRARAAMHTHSAWPLPHHGLGTDWGKIFYYAQTSKPS